MEAEGAAGKDCDVRELTEQRFPAGARAATPKAAERSREVGNAHAVQYHGVMPTLQRAAPGSREAEERKGGSRVRVHPGEAGAERMEIRF